MLDLARYQEPEIAPRAVFDRLDERRTRPRFMVPDGEGGFVAVTWDAFAREIRQIALFLAASGFEPGERAVVFANNRVQWLSSALAIQAAGGVMVPIYPASTAEQARYVVEHSDARFAFVESALPALPVEHTVTLDSESSWSRALEVGAERDRERPREFEERLAAVTLDRPAIMLYTSGTTGNPKGVPLSHENVGVNGLDWLRLNAPLLEEGLVDLLWLPMSHIFGLGEACIGNTLGFTTYLSNPATVLADLPRVKPHVFMSVPAYWEKLATTAAQDRDPAARLAEITGGRLQFCLSGGAGLKREIKQQFHDSGLLIIEGYGLTECSPTLTLNRADDFRFDSVGKPLPSVELRLADDGEILARGPSIFSGYHKDAAATREAFTADGWFKTGDVGRFTEDGFLQIVDRKKEILVTAGGKNVPPANIELRFADEPAIAHAVVYGDGKKYLVAGIWIDPVAIGDRTPDEAHSLVRAAVDRVNAGLARFEQIKKFCILDTPLTVASGLLTSTLKVRRKQVYTAFRTQFEALYE